MRGFSFGSPHVQSYINEGFALWSFSQELSRRTGMLFAKSLSYFWSMKNKCNFLFSNLYFFVQKKTESEFSRLLHVAEKSPGLYFSYDVNITLRWILFSTYWMLGYTYSIFFFNKCVAITAFIWSFYILCM